jgi:transcriptional regulator with XRE-family HTH domain
MPDPKAGPRGRFGEAMRDLWLGSGKMMIKQIAKRSGWSATTVSDILHGKRFPEPIEKAEDIVTAFGGNFEDIRRLWYECNREMNGPGGTRPEGVEDVTFPASWYSTNSEFYDACRQGVMSATQDIRVTYIRQCPPNEVSSTQAAEYFAAILDWAAAEPGERSVTRIYGIPSEASTARTGLLRFLRMHLQEITDRDLKNYTPLVYEYTARADGLNMALFDQDVSFLAISLGYNSQKLSGIRIDNERYTRSLITYFDQLSGGCTPLRDYLPARDEKL